MTGNETALLLNKKEFGDILAKMYGGENVDHNLLRYEGLVKGFIKRYGDNNDIRIYSSPGRTEIGGNHTDHNNGKVLAASINLDCIGVASKNEEQIINVVSLDYNMDFSIDINTLKSNLDNGTVKLVRGLLDGFKKRGHKIGGFNTYISSNVISAAGVSSSAAFEMLFCVIINDLYNDNSLDVVECAKIGQYAENQ